MPYVNFKEENYKLDKQIKNRKENNKKIRSQIKKDKTLLSGYSLNGEYSFKNTKKQMIGTQGVLKDEDFQVISNEDFICANFFNCKFQNIKFINCSFIGCNFKKCSFGGGGIIFENCTFTKTDSIKTPSLNVILKTAIYMLNLKEVMYRMHYLKDAHLKTQILNCPTCKLLL